MQAARVFESCLYAEDLEAAKDFYTRVLGLAMVSENPGRGVVFRCGEGFILIFDPRRTRVKESVVPLHGCTGAGHLAFLAEDHELPAWRERLAACGIEIETEVEWPVGGRSLYFRDPAGNSLEIAPPTLWGYRDSPKKEE